jgi:glycosyltransferase involved in cell wall biosynthesis
MDIKTVNFPGEMREKPSRPAGSGPFITVGIATTGRREILSHTIEVISRQSRLPDALIICAVTPDDFDSTWLGRLPFCRFVPALRRGLTSQRNSILSAADASDIIVFFDDDFFPEENYLREIETIFNENQHIVAMTGRPVEDGANGPGIPVERGLEIISLNHVPGAAGRATISTTYGTYGCNMSFRMEPIRQHKIRFDENLPLYGWQEDIDFSRQLSPYGNIMESDTLRGVHLGSKGGRTSGVKFGYSQIANPVYLMKKGTMSASFAFWLIARNIAANLRGFVRSEPWIDRKGRLIGNLRAVIDLLSRRISPGRIVNLD